MDEESGYSVDQTSSYISGSGNFAHCLFFCNKPEISDATLTCNYVKHLFIVDQTCQEISYGLPGNKWVKYQLSLSLGALGVHEPPPPPTTAPPYDTFGT